MITSLRKKFIITAMVSIFAVLLLIMGAINIINYTSMGRSVSSRIELIAENGGEYPQDRKIFKSGNFNEEAPYDTRYFTVTLDEDGTVMTINTGRISAISTKQASAYASELFGAGKTLGYVGNYRYKQFVETSSPGDATYLYVFVDCERELNTFRSFAIASVSISVAGLVLVFILVYILSGIMIKPVAESYEKQRRFITDASHELKTPLTIIDANTEVIEMTSGENEWTASTRKQVKRLASLTEKLVFLSRMDEGNSRLEMLDFSLTDAVLDVTEPYAAVAKSRSKTLLTAIDPDITLHGSEKDIRQLISILMDNAMKYTPDGGTIEVKLYLSGRERILSVYNTVEKIQPGKHDEFFERFYRADASRNSQTGGFGIGLSVAYAIVAAHKGKITARSNDDTSVIFTVCL